MFYLVHGPIMSTLGDRLYAAVGMQRTNHAIVVPHWIGRCPIPVCWPAGSGIEFLAASSYFTAVHAVDWRGLDGFG